MNVIHKCILIGILSLAGVTFTHFYIKDFNNQNLAMGEKTFSLKYEALNNSKLNDVIKTLDTKYQVTSKQIPELNELSRETTIIRHQKTPYTSLKSWPLLVTIAAIGLSLMGSMFFDNIRHKKKGVPLFISSLDNFEYPVVMVDNTLKISWQNQRSHQLNYSASTLESIFDELVDGSSIAIDNKNYSVLVTDIDYQGSRHFIAHLIPISEKQPKQRSRFREVNQEV